MGYHLVVDRVGFVHVVRPVGCIGSHTPGFNHISVGLCLVGGRDADGALTDNFTPEQRGALVVLMAAFLTEWPKAQVKAHHELRGYQRDGYQCPCVGNLASLVEAARAGAALGCRPLSEMTQRNPRRAA